MGKENIFHTEAIELVRELSSLRKMADPIVTQADIARRLGTAQSNISKLEKTEGASVTTETIVFYASRVIGWAEPIAGPEALSPEAEARKEQLRSQQNEASRQWKRTHPERVRQNVAKWKKTPKGSAYTRDYQRTYQQNRRAMERDKSNRGDDIS